MHEHEYKFDANRNFEDDLQLVKKSLDACSYFTFDQVLETQKKFNTKKLSANTKNMEGYFKEIKEGESAHGGHKKPVNECEKQLDELVAIHLQESGASSHQKEKKFFSFLKWFKKNKENSNLKNVKESSGASSPMFERKRSSSCESIDTLFSTQTVRSFAYIPTTQYEPSAPPYSLLDDFKGLENSFGDPSSEKSKLENVEPCYEKKKKRKAPGPPRLTRENSLPTTLEHRKNDNELNLNDVKTYHRRTVSESFKDKKAGAYCHVQGKRKAPLPPPTVTLYPNLQKLNNPCQSLHKKKKPAPLPPEPKPECESPKPELAKRNSPKNPTENSKDDLKVSKPLKRDAKQKDENIASEEQKLKIEENKNNQSLSPLPSRPWYKRSHRESGGSNFIRKELLKNFEKKKNKEVEDWMPEVGFSRKSFSTENSHSKFNIFSRLEKHEDKRKEEKRKSQISILTNISELDKEAAEIVKKEQAEEKKMMAANDAKYYSPNSFPNSSNVFQRICKNESEGVNSNNVSSKLVKPEEIKEESDKVTQRDLKRTAENNESKRSERDAEIISENVTSNLTETNTVQAKKSEINISDSVREVTDNTKINYSADASNSTTQDALSKAQNSNLAINLNRFDVTNKEVYYLNEPWVCPKCTLENPGWRVFCEICSSVKPRFLYNSNGNLNGNQTQLCTNATPKSISEKSDRPKNLEPKRTSPPTEEVHDSEKESEKNETGENVKEQKKVQSNNNASVDYNDKMQPQEKQEQNALLKPETSMSTKSDESISGPRNRPNKLDLSSHVKEIPNESQKYGAVKKTQVSPPKQNKEKVVEAYLITKTTVLEDIIIKRADQNSKVSTSAQTNSTAAPRDAGNKIRPPPRKKVTDANAGGITSKEVRVKEIQNSSNHREPIDLSLTAEDVSKENLKRYGKDLEELTKKLIRADGLADFKAKIKTMAPDTEMNTVAVKKLLKKLETAINDGDHLAASGLAKELALLKINCSVTRQMADNRMSTNCSKIT